jgi:hypothetical protein
VSIATIRTFAKSLKLTLRPYLEMVWAFSFWKSEKTEQKVKIDLQLEQNKYRIGSRYQKWYKFLKAPVRHFRRFITPKWKGSESRAAIGVKMSIDRNA